MQGGFMHIGRDHFYLVLASPGIIHCIACECTGKESTTNVISGGKDRINSAFGGPSKISNAATENS